MKTTVLSFGCVLAATLASVRAAEPFPFVLPWDDGSAGVTSLAQMLDKPAGAHGFITAHDGHLWAGEKRFRIFGVNVAFGGNFPSHADAEKVAARMAKFGIDCVRFHHMDTGTAPAGLLQKDRLTFDPESLDRLDYFIAQLKQNGIYANLNLHVGNEYPGMQKWDGAPNYFKGVDNFYPPMIEQQRDYARKLLTHVNPYTKLPYADEPAVALIEINNENGLIMEWNNGSLDKMPAPYAAEFSRQWNAWLTKKYGDDAKLSAAWKKGEEPLGAELVKNGSASNWNFERHEGAQASLQAQDSDIAVKIDAPGKEAWHVQFSQVGLKLQEGKSYTVAFRVRATKAAKMSVNLSQTHAPWKVLATHEVKLSPEWQDVRFTLVPNETDDRARLAFSNLGAQPGEFAFSGISLRPGGITAFREGEKLGQIPFFRKGDLGGRTPTAQQDWNRFLIDTESAYWPGMMRYIKDDLKAHSLVLGSATGFSPWIVQSQLDVVDAHSYWQHPHFPHRPWDADDWTVKNESMAGAPDGGALTTLAMRRVAGKPFIVTEYNHAAPNTYSSEAFLEICALAALQDWDGIFAFAYCHRLNDWGPGRITSFFDIDQHPAKMATLPAAVTMFYRADITPPYHGHFIKVTPEQAIDSIRKGSSWVEARAYGMKWEEMFQYPIGMKLSERAVQDKLTTAPTKELAWDAKARRMEVWTWRTFAIAGKIAAGEKIEGHGLTIVPGATMQDWATISLTSMDGASLGKSERILITATGYAGNADMQWKDASHTSVGKNWGTGPSVVEGIPATITIASIHPLKAWSLDERGQRKEQIPIWKEQDGLTTIELSPAQKTLWWELATDAAK